MATTKRRDYLKLTYETAERWFFEGRLTTRQWQTYCRVWGWGAFRMSGSDGDAQWAYQKKYGFDALKRRINRIRRVMGWEEY